MKKVLFTITTLMLVSMFALTGCQDETVDPGTPPQEVISGDNSNQTNNDNSENTDNTASADSKEWMENVISVRIGRDSSDELSVNMIDNAAANTMLGYLSDSALLFPTYTYDEDAGFVGQNVRGNYTRDDEVVVTDIRCGELYLFSDGQLRLYFKDVPGANITATPVGIFADSSVVTDAVISAYESNKGDTWGVDVYFWITKN
ncbi:MAG: L,D-transpeptidase [Clostridium sp.]|nr:L,D-transpeptidase [Clostridium sp.]